LCRPFPNAWNFTQSTEESFGVDHPLKADPPVADGAGENSNGFSSRPWQADTGKLGVGKNLGRGKQMCETVGRRERLPKTAHYSSSQSGGALHRNLLTQNCPRREFETIPTTRDPESGIRIYGRGLILCFRRTRIESPKRALVNFAFCL